MFAFPFHFFIIVFVKHGGWENFATDGVLHISVHIAQTNTVDFRNFLINN